MSDSMDSFCNEFGISDFASFYNWMTGELHNLKFDFSLLVSSSLTSIVFKVLKTLFGNSPLRILAKFLYLIYRSSVVASGIFWTAYDEAIKVGKAQGWMITKHGAFDNKIVNI